MASPVRRAGHVSTVSRHNQAVSGSPRVIAGGALALVIGASAVVLYAERKPDGTPAARQVVAQATPSVAPVPEVAPAPPDLPEISYWRAASGFPQDSAPHSLEAVAEGLRPDKRIAVYDAPGGQARAFLPRTIRGMPVTGPIGERQPGGLAGLMPSINRRIAWVPEAAGDVRPLRDQLVVDLSESRLTWLRDGRRHGYWKVAVGSSRTPTPRGRPNGVGRPPTPGRGPDSTATTSASPS